MIFFLDTYFAHTIIHPYRRATNPPSGILRRPCPAVNFRPSCRLPYGPTVGKVAALTSYTGADPLKIKLTDPEMRLITAWVTGQQDARRAHTSEACYDNPYPPHTPLHSHYDNGFKDGAMVYPK